MKGSTIKHLALCNPHSFLRKGHGINSFRRAKRDYSTYHDSYYDLGFFVPGFKPRHMSERERQRRRRREVEQVLWRHLRANIPD